jgi:ABC transporter substrate binding protein
VEAIAGAIHNQAEIESVVASQAREPYGALMVIPNTFLVTHRAEIVSLANRYRVPAVYFRRLFTDAGGLLSYGFDLHDQFRRAAAYVDKIFNGEKPSDLPVQAPVKFEFVINLKTANHARRDHRALAAQVGIGARHVVHDADLDGAVGVLRFRPGASEGDRECRETDEPVHWAFRRCEGSVPWPRFKAQIIMELSDARAERFYCALALRRRSAIRLKLPGQDDPGLFHAAKPHCGSCW